jgi:3-isopropylmalate/(R)-2-methylmalate dehydratase large subunit
MGMTATEKIFAAHADRAQVEPGEIVTTRVDRAVLHDITGPITIEQLDAMGVRSIPDPDRVVLVNDHFAPPKDVPSAEGLRTMHRFAERFGLQHMYDIGTGGIEHTLVPELGLLKPGDLVIGTDSHTCTHGAYDALGIGLGSSDVAAAIALGETWFTVPATIRVEYRGSRQPFVTGKDLILALLGKIGVDGALERSLEFVGEGVAALNMDERMALCNMAVEASATTCIVPADEATRSWAEAKKLPWNPVTSDNDAVFDSEVKIDLAEVEPLCAKPFSPDNVALVKETKGIKVDQVYIGNCSNGTLTDMRQAASLFKGRRVARNVRAIAVPATQNVYRAALKEGLIDIFLEAGVVVGPPTCGACAGLHMGVLADGQTCIATINRNFRGRMGAANAQIYLANAYVAAASAVAGELVDPREIA